ncbi:MAG: FIG00470522: hypothetical protein [uncultured Sulfurovum sp.]|uniref:Uncharacterized protein n=1 Tax=uncultured Sulfurovum sp. TaxID=269237 RepID=A0A6S6SLI2_9BACT|nr:MAG: FIG00470522: hypothetical protein [uncultured Sulfurovum sp.]
MEELIFNIEFLSDIVLPSSSNTEGKIEPLDFIAGSNFLGMVAKDKEYNKFENSFDVFHSGKVRFGDATLLQEDKPTYKIPLSFFHEKLKKHIVVNQLHTPLSELTQAKQFRAGYITKDFSLILLDYNYAQKSGYDKSKRRSKDSSMYGYSSMKNGTEWQFVLKYDTAISDADIERIKKNLLGKKRLGKSKSSQYGQVKITLDNASVESIENMTFGDEIILYVKSRLALVDEGGNPTYNLNYLTDGLKDEQIDWNRTQLRTSTYNRYDGTRKSKDTQRVVINSGSVIVLNNIKKDVTPAMIEKIKNGVGVYLSEGFGEVLVNPSFLDDKPVTLHDFIKKQDLNSAVSISDEMVKFLFMKEEEKKQNLQVATKVHEFIEKNRNIYSKAMNAQWGTIGSLCASSSDEFIKNSVQAYIVDGVAKDKWQGKKSESLLDAIDKSSSPLAFTKLLCMEMPKVKDSDKKEQKDD